MSEIIPKDTRYIPMVQQRYCCVVASVLMVMYRKNIPLLSQELLGRHFGVVVKPKVEKLFWNGKLFTGKKPKSGYGTRLGSGGHRANIAFKKLKIPLRMTYHPISRFADIALFKSFLFDTGKKDKDILVCFDWGILNNDQAKKHSGHVSVVDKVYPKKGIVRIIDPSIESPKWRLIKIEKLKKAMEFHGDKGLGGFWELKKTKK